MLDFLYFMFSQFFNLFLWLDSLTIVGTLSLLRVIIIVFLIVVIYHVIGGRTHD